MSSTRSGSFVNHDDFMADLDASQAAKDKKSLIENYKAQYEYDNNRSYSREDDSFLYIPDDPRDKDTPFMRRLARFFLCCKDDSACRRRSSDIYIPQSMGSTTSSEFGIGEGALMRSTRRAKRKSGTRRAKRK